jgi:hypothetical protein
VLDLFTGSQTTKANHSPTEEGMNQLMGGNMMERKNDTILVSLDK